MGDFLSEYWSGAVALVALVQPWAVAAWREMIRKGVIDVYNTGTIEVGFSTFGPIIGLQGTLRARRREVFVKKMAVTVIREKDSARHELEWGILKSPWVKASSPQDVILGLPSGFLLAPTTPSRFSLSFLDNQTLNELKRVLTDVKKEWNRFEDEQIALLQGATQGDAALRARLQAVIEKGEYGQHVVFRQFVQSPQYASAFDRLRSLLYWEAGKYSLDLRVETDRPHGSFGRSWNFTLAQVDSDNLRDNMASILEAACREIDAPFSFAYLQYEDSAPA